MHTSKNFNTMLTKSMLNVTGYTPQGRQHGSNKFEKDIQINKIIESALDGYNVVTGLPHIAVKTSDSNDPFAVKNTKVNITPTYVITIPFAQVNKNHNTVPTTKILQALQHALVKTVKAPVELQLIMLKRPHLDGQTLARYISKQLQDNKFKIVMKKVFAAVKVLHKSGYDNNPHTSALVGIKVELAGRLISERSRPRLTEQTAKLGKVIRGNNLMTTLDAHTDKNKKNSFTVRVYLNQTI